jgi:hypothetical protein
MFCYALIASQLLTFAKRDLVIALTIIFSRLRLYYPKVSVAIASYLNGYSN